MLIYSLSVSLIVALRSWRAYSGLFIGRLAGAALLHLRLPVRFIPRFPVSLRCKRPRLEAPSVEVLILCDVHALTNPSYVWGGTSCGCGGSGGMDCSGLVYRYASSLSVYSFNLDVARTTTPAGRAFSAPPLSITPRAPPVSPAVARSFPSFWCFFFFLLSR